MNASDLAVALSVLASTFRELDQLFRDFERLDRSIRDDKNLLVEHVRACMAAIARLQDELRAPRRRDLPLSDRVDVVTSSRLKHVRDDIGALSDRLYHLENAIGSLIESETEASRLAINATQWAILAAVAFARTDLAVLHRRLSALSQYYSSPNALLEGEQDPEDTDLTEALAHYDAIRPGEALRLARADADEPQAVPQRDRRALRCHLVPVMFATDRTKTAESLVRHVDYGNRLEGTTLSYGLAEVSIPRGSRHRAGRLERPSLWKLQYREDPAEHVTIVTSEERSRADWSAIARERIMEGDQHSALVFIHGFHVSFADAVRRTGQIGWDLQFHGLITAFSWCSEGAIRSYLTDERNARLAAPRLLEFFGVLRREVGVNTIHVIAHSMGNLVLIEALRTSPATPKSEPTVDEVVFAAPDYDAEEFRNAIKQLRGKARRYTLYGSEHDRALAASKALRSDYPRAGDGGKNVLVAEGIETIDASAVGEDLLGLGHSYFGSTRTVLTDLFYVIQESLPPSRRSGMQERKDGGVKYWVFVP